MNRLIATTIVIAVFMGCNSNQEKKEEEEDKTLRADTTLREPEAFSISPDSTMPDPNAYSEFIKSPYTDTILLENYITKKRWFESLYLLRKRDSVTERIFEEPISEGTTIHAQFIDLKRGRSVFFEVFDMTHQGNGYYTLYEYKKGVSKKILEIRAVDRHEERQGITADSCFVMENDRLFSEYVDLNKDGYLDIKFSGTGLVFTEATRKDTKPFVLERQFVWNNSRKRFEEVMSKRKGFWYFGKFEID